MTRIRAHAEIARERRRTYAAGAAHGIKPLVLVEFAEHRAGLEIVQRLDTRDFPLEVREELADGRNYWVWLAEQVDRAAHLNLPLVDAVRAEVHAGLGATVVAFEHAERAATLMSDWRHALDLAA